MFGTVMFYMLGYSNNFIGETAGNPLLQIAVVIGWAAVGFAIYTACILILMAFGILGHRLPAVHGDGCHPAHHGGAARPYRAAVLEARKSLTPTLLCRG